MSDVEFTVVFKGHPRNVQGNPFDLVTEFGKVVSISVGNSVEEADNFRAALEEIAEGEIGRSADKAQAALDASNATLKAALEAGKQP